MRDGVDCRNRPQLCPWRGEALKAAVKVRVIQGVELDCVYRGQNFHLLGYGIDVNREDLQPWNKIFYNRREGRQRKNPAFPAGSRYCVDADEILAGAG
mgnify:CR=1 FL=1